MKKSLLIILVLSLAFLVVAACGSGGDSSGVVGDADAAAGRELFAQARLGAQPGCITCHSLDGSTIVGPSMQGVGSRLSAAEIRTSILIPDIIVAEGFPEGTMPDVWGDELTGEQVNQLAAYLFSLK